MGGSAIRGRAAGAADNLWGGMIALAFFVCSGWLPIVWIVGAAGAAGKILGKPLAAPFGDALNVQDPWHAQLRPVIPVVVIKMP